jgi:DNA polymerase III epsilon subunit-like protein
MTTIHSPVLYQQFVEKMSTESPKNTRQKDLTIPKFHRRIMVLDTESSGLMPKHKPGTAFPPIEAYPHIMQFSWILYNVLTNEIEETVNEYVKIPKTAEISKESIAVHKITREIVEEKGKPIVPLLSRFFEAYMKCDCIVAHNLHFDGELVRKEMWRNRKELDAKIKVPDRVNMMCGVFTKKFNAAYHIDTFCTMMNTVELCGIEFAKKPDVGFDTDSKKPDVGFDSDSKKPDVGFDSDSKKPDVGFDSDSKKPDVGFDSEGEVSVERPKIALVSHPIANENTRKKFPRLIELYRKLFDDVLPSDLHNSIIDVLVCLRCFLKVRGVKELSESDFYALIEKYSR